MSEEHVVVVASMATHLHNSEETVRQCLRTEQLSGYNLGGQAGWRIPAAEVERMLASRTGKRSRA